MKYNKTVLLKDGRECTLRNGTQADAQEVFDVFNLTHAETDYLLSYPDENSFNVEQEGEFLKAKTESCNEIEIIAVVDGKVAGTAGIDAVGNKCKTKHRAEFGISIAKDFWGLGFDAPKRTSFITFPHPEKNIRLIAKNTRHIF